MKRIDLAALRDAYIDQDALAIDGSLTSSELNDLGVYAAGQGEHAKAISHFHAAITKTPDVAHIYSNYALSLRDLGFFADAATILEHALLLDGGNAQIAFNLANLKYELGDQAAALTHYEQAVRLNGNFPQLFLNYALVALEQQEYALALRLARRGASMTPTIDHLYDQFLIVLASLDAVMAQTATGLQRIEDRLLTHESAGLAAEYIRLLACAQPSDLSMRSMALIERAINEQWSPPEQFAPTAWKRIIAEYDLPTDAGDETWPMVADLLLSSALIPDLETERWLIRHRRALFCRNDADALNERQTSFYTALAQQSFLRNYLFPKEDAERSHRDLWKNAIETALDERKNPPLLPLLRLAASTPLHHIRQPERLLNLNGMATPVTRLLRQQVANPLRERELEASIPTLSAGSNPADPVTKRYRDHPYPQWTWPGQLHNQERFNIYLAQRLGHSTFAPLKASSVVRILVAGCGTGRHSHLLARSVSDAQITAIDISRPSLAFAQRQKLEDSLETIQYWEADLMHLASWDARFDVIECAGVLHHLADPERGLGILLNLLKDGGFIMLALYCRRARRPILSLRERLELAGEVNIDHAIHEARRIVSEDPELISIASYRDFYSFNECADLLVHPNERSYDLNEIKRLLEENNLVFRGFEMSWAQRARFKLKNRHPSDLTDFSKLESFENDDPEVFSGMYHFWAQKAPKE